MKPQMFVFMGGQGSGKGTFAKLLIKQQNKDFNYIEAGAILRTLPTDSVIGQKILHGELLNDNEIFPVISQHIDVTKDTILDGFPRTVGQAKWLVENFADKFNIRVIFLNISEEKMIAHIKKRIAEGGNRTDDADENAVHKRIESFKTITIPAVQLLQNESRVDFIDIHLPSDDINTNFNYILEKIK
jgi:adenylate kinase